MIKAEIVADSLNPSGDRLTTFVLEYPRFVHAEFMTHRMFSKNAASSRAIPIEKMIQQVRENPAMPEFWGKNQSGMQAMEELNDTKKVIPWTLYHNSDDDIPSWYDNKGFVTERRAAKETWLEARDTAIRYVQTLCDLGLHKQISNRILEPWFHIRVICSATEYENFFALRAHQDAQPEIRVLAEKMLAAYNASEPNKLKAGEWHIPFGDRIEEKRLYELFDDGSGVVHLNSEQWKEALEKAKIKIAIARCARISYLNFEGKDDYAADIKLCDRLFGNIPRHLSPAEHVACAMGISEFVGNFRGFRQYRKFFVDENLKDQRVKRHVNEP